MVVEEHLQKGLEYRNRLLVKIRMPFCAQLIPRDGALEARTSHSWENLASFLLSSWGFL